jgi:uncharacterized protein
MKNTISREFQIFVKPVSAECNLECMYCYYLEKENLYHTLGSKKMTYGILEEYIIQHIKASSDKNIFFSWHGGEPVLAGLDFFRKVVLFQKKHKPGDRNIVNGIQTNATLLNDEFCRFLAGENFFAGVSIDGPQHLHDKFRISKNKSGSFTKVLRGYNLLRKYNVPTEILTVVSSENVLYPLEVYNFLKTLESGFITFLPLVQRDLSSETGVSRISVSAEAFGSFLKIVFDEWSSKDIGTIKIQIIEEAVRVAFRQDHTLCIFKKTCGGVPIVEYNGDFYSCDHFVNKEHLIGNINSRSISEMLDSQEQILFGESKLNTLPEYCLKCEVREMCNGECPKNRFVNTPYGDPGLNYLCPGYKSFFNHITPFVEAIKEEYRRKNL